MLKPIDVFHNGYYELGGNIVRCVINDLGGYSFKTLNNQIYNTLLKHINPLEITNDLLERLGFEFQTWDTHSYYQTKTEGVMEGYVFGRIWVFLLLFEKEKYRFFGQRNTDMRYPNTWDYVHELQRLLYSLAIRELTLRKPVYKPLNEKT